MPDFLTLRTTLATWLEKDETSLPTIVRKDIINMAQKEYTRRYNSRHTEFSDTFATVALQNNYVRPAGFKNHIDFWIATATTKHKTLIYQDKSDFDIKYPDMTETDEPVNFTEWNNEIFIGPTPDAIYTINRLYHRILPDLVGDTDTNTLTDDPWEILLFGSLSFSELFGVDDERMPLWKQLFEQKMREDVMEYKRSKSLRFSNQGAISR